MIPFGGNPQRVICGKVVDDLVAIDMVYGLQAAPITETNIVLRQWGPTVRAVADGMEVAPILYASSFGAGYRVRCYVSHRWGDTRSLAWSLALGMVIGLLVIMFAWAFRPFPIPANYLRWYIVIRS
jgi:hypothetical protein